MVGAPRAQGLHLEHEAAARGLGARVRWLHGVAPERMPRLYHAVDAFVSASHNEGLSNSLLEAMASGLPVTATDVGGHREFVSDGHTGLLVPPRDIDRLAAALRRVVTATVDTAGLGRAARERVVALGSYYTNATHLLRYFEQVIRNYRSPQPPTAVSRTSAGADAVGLMSRS